jgi:hypothetical protein
MPPIKGSFERGPSSGRARPKDSGRPAGRGFATLDRRALAARYKQIQAEIVAELNRETGLGLSTSDAFLLAHLEKEKGDELDRDQRAAIGRFQRGFYYRFCLTPYFEAKEKGSS